MSFTDWVIESKDRIERDGIFLGFTIVCICFISVPSVALIGSFQGHQFTNVIGMCWLFSTRAEQI